MKAKWNAHPPLRNSLLAALIAGIGFISFNLGLFPEETEIGLFSVVILLGGYHWSREGIEELYEEGKVGIEILMMAATAGSVILGLWDEAAFLVVLYGAAEGVEEYAYEKTRTSIRKLLDLVPETARVLRNGEEILIPAEDLSVGDVFLVKPGESIPTDGVIQKGESSVNEAAVTGKSIPVEKRVGDSVFAGTINQEGVLEIPGTDWIEKTIADKVW